MVPGLKFGREMRTDETATASDEDIHEQRAPGIHPSYTELCGAPHTVPTVAAAQSKSPGVPRRIGHNVDHERMRRARPGVVVDRRPRRTRIAVSVRFRIRQTRMQSYRVPETSMCATANPRLSSRNAVRQ